VEVDEVCVSVQASEEDAVWVCFGHWGRFGS